MLTKMDFVSGKVQPDQFYTQFVSLPVRVRVLDWFPLAVLKKSKMADFSDLSDAHWDRCAFSLSMVAGLPEAVFQHSGQFFTKIDGFAIAKVAARMILKDAHNV